uniref:glucan endo-1,3-beta-D-glucosidase n=1 Tax=Debaryomyces hansenii TaxID=4959 RepID=E9NR84_DEBHN|nr:endo-1,3-beta-glucanase [Debaryomyces hansenii]
MSISNMKSMSALVQLSASSDDTTNYIEMPLVQGMGFVTSVYHGDLIPEIGSLVGIDSFTQEVVSDSRSTKRSNILSNILKYRVTLYSGSEWLIYVTLPSSSDSFELTISDTSIVGSAAIDGLIIQSVVAPEDSSLETYYDQSAGMYVTGADVKGSVSDDSAEYSFVYSTEGSSESGNPIIFALPHHVQSLTSDCYAAALDIQLPSTTKGNMTAFLTNELVMSETLETSISFLPWSQTMTGSLSYTSEQLNLIVNAANSELNVDIAETVASLDSTYSSGKVIDKYAYILLVVSEIIQDEEATNSTLSALKDAFTPFLENKQYYPFMYDQKFKGVTSTASNDGDTGADYGSGYYNDHHFHYGYYVHAAAVVGYIDKKLGGTWAEDNKDWVNALIRDVANPSEDDTYFPVSRMFDWFQGHSWAAGLFASGDGKNEESTSEDYNFAYAMKMWGNVIGDGSMESRGSLMLSVMSRAMNMYFYYKSDNTVEPSDILPNKVSGIFFENKVTYTTYFGSPDEHPEYVHGIHMLPITPASSLIRIPSYVEEEWDDQISTFIDDVDSGWTGILRLNQALYDASTSYSFFSSDSWTDTYLDNGQSRTWSLAFSAGVMNAS